MVSPLFPVPQSTELSEYCRPEPWSGTYASGSANLTHSTNLTLVAQ